MSPAGVRSAQGRRGQRPPWLRLAERGGDVLKQRTYFNENDSNRFQKLNPVHFRALFTFVLFNLLRKSSLDYLAMVKKTSRKPLLYIYTYVSLPHLNVSVHNRVNVHVCCELLFFFRHTFSTLTPSSAAAQLVVEVCRDSDPG